MTALNDQPFVLPSQRCVLESLDLAGMSRLATSLVRRLPGGTAVGLVGTLGAGKTSLVQAIAAACEIDASDVTSPTFTLLQSYRGSRVIHHLDAYRIRDEDEFYELGIEELYADKSALTLIEWADRVASSLPVQTLWIQIEIEADASLRTVTLASSLPELAGCAEQVASDVA